jgi:Xaa-Pro aminopeptidase
MEIYATVKISWFQKCLIGQYLFKTFSLLVDVTAYHRGFHGDLNETLLVGQVSESAKKLVQVTWECLEKAIEIGS